MTVKEKVNKKNKATNIYKRKQNKKKRKKRNDYTRASAKVHLSYALLTIKKFMEYQPLHIKINSATQITTH